LHHPNEFKFPTSNPPTLIVPLLNNLACSDISFVSFPIFFSFITHSGKYESICIKLIIRILDNKNKPIETFLLFERIIDKRMKIFKIKDIKIKINIVILVNE
jgi:hypothetical protein